MELGNKTALVTGGSRGIGRAIALELAAAGANVAIFYAGNAEAALDAVEAAGAFGVRAKAYRCNVADFAAAGAAVAAVLEDFGKVDILVNNAGVARDGLIVQLSEQDFDEVVSTSLKGAFNLIRHLYRPFVRQRGGRIINIGSVVGLHGNTGQANYAAAKAGLAGLTMSTAKELAARGITCNLVAPGFIATEMTGAMPEKARRRALEAIPAGRMGTPQEVAALVAFLAGDAAAYITGEIIRIDGGMGM